MACRAGALVLAAVGLGLDTEHFGCEGQPLCASALAVIGHHGAVSPITSLREAH
jgi:hypothetical protein